MSSLPVLFSKHSLLSLALSAAFSCAYAADEPLESAELETVTVTASADASKGGLIPAYPGGQVAKGSRVGILGNQTNLETPFSPPPPTPAV